MADDLSQFSDVEILAMTSLGESESLGSDGMHQTASTMMNRCAANLSWMGGSSARQVCLQPQQYQCWEPNSQDRERILAIATQNQTYGPYLTALNLATLALAGSLPDCTRGAVSYFDSSACKPPYWSIGKEPCAVIGQRWFYPLNAVE